MKYITIKTLEEYLYWGENMVKISVLLATNRINKHVFPYIKKCIDGLDNLQDDTFTSEFKDLIIGDTKHISHFLEPTLRSLELQKFKDFEVILCH